MPIEKLLKKFHWFDIKQFLSFSGGDLMFQMTGIVSELIVLKLVDINDIGIWQFCLLLQSYMVIFRMGIINSFNREYIVEKELGNVETAQKYLETTGFHTLISMFLQAMTFTGICIYYGLTDKKLLTLATLSMVFFTCLDAMTNFEEAKLRGGLKFNVLGKSKIIFGITSFVTLLFPYYFTFYGLIARALLMQLFMYSYYRILGGPVAKMSFSYSHWFQLFKDGWKFWLLGYLRSFNKTIPRLFLVSFAGISALGLYTPVNWILTGFTLFTGSLNTYLYPYISQQFAKGNKDMNAQILSINGIALLLAVPISVIVYFIIPNLIDNYLPKYHASISVMQMVIFASLFDMFTVSTSVWYASKDWTRLFTYNIIIILISVLMFSLLHFSQYDLLNGTGWVILGNSFFSALLVVTMILTKHKISNVCV